MNLWQSNKYIPTPFGRFFYKKFFLFKIAKPLKLKCWTKWSSKRKRRHRLNRKRNGEKANPKWTKNRMKELGGKYGFECRMCLAVGDLTLDHIIPLCILKHKANRLSNLQILCRDCHKRKTLWDYKIWNIKANLPIEKLSTVIL